MCSSDLGQLTLKGTVPLILELSISPIGNLNDLPLTTTFSEDIATVTEKTNRRTGYDIEIESLNGSALGSGPFFKGDDGGNSDTLAYSLTYGGVGVTFTSGIASIVGPTIKTTSAGTPKTVAMQFDGIAAFLSPDIYQDTLTFTIIAK